MSGARITLAPFSAAISQVRSLDLASMTITSSRRPSLTLFTMSRMVPMVSSSSSVGKMKETVTPSSFLRCRSWSKSFRKSLASKTPLSHGQHSGMLLGLPLALSVLSAPAVPHKKVLSSRLVMTLLTASTQPRGPTPLTRSQFLRGSASSQYSPSGRRTKKALSTACNMLRSFSASPKPIIEMASNLTSSRVRSSETAVPLSMPYAVTVWKRPPQANAMPCLRNSAVRASLCASSNSEQIVCE
mmetsp:Transcript_45974/g.137389  ORF Transcript_45974/g.137389 Transcript_45974/m.137389 type:complete len:243 (-) Transcript_45974:584-1312(-)